MGLIVYGAICAVALEFSIHIIYFAVTGKAGINDPPFEYLRDIANTISGTSKSSPEILR